MYEIIIFVSPLTYVNRHVIDDWCLKKLCSAMSIGWTRLLKLKLIQIYCRQRLPRTTAYLFVLRLLLFFVVVCADNSATLGSVEVQR